MTIGHIRSYYSWLPGYYPDIATAILFTCLHRERREQRKPPDPYAAWVDLGGES